MEPAIDPTPNFDYPLPGDAPTWIHDNLSRPGVAEQILIDNVLVNYLSWEWHDQTRPAIILVHGFRGHAHWWSFLAPFFLDTHRVAAIELSGMGDSGHRDQYEPLRFAKDIVGFIEHFSLSPATLIGHSYGGSQVLKAAALAPDCVGHAIIVDTYVNFPDRDQLPVIPALRHLKTHASRDQALKRFRLDPPQPDALEILLHYIAYHSVKLSDAGWCWKFDPNLTNVEEADGPNLLSRVHTKVDYLYGERSIVAGGGRAQRIFDLLPQPNKLIALPGAHHHLMLDQPLQLVQTLKTLLQTDN